LNEQPVLKSAIFSVLVSYDTIIRLFIRFAPAYFGYKVFFLQIFTFLAGRLEWLQERAKEI
jgi:hypothetical protein